MKQKSWALLFLITIILPAAILSAFGLSGIRNEKFRLEQQWRNEGISLLDSVKSDILGNFDQLETELQVLISNPAFSGRNYHNIRPMVQKLVQDEPLIDQFFIVFNGNPPWFPPFWGEGSGFHIEPGEDFPAHIQELREEAWNLEYIKKDFTGAISLLSHLLTTVEASQLRMELLSDLARNHMKLGEFKTSAELYSEIIREAPVNIRYRGTYLPLSVRFQLIDCLLETGDSEKALKETLEAFKQILNQYSAISEDQLKTYVSLSQNQFKAIREDDPQIFSSDLSYAAEFDSLNLIYTSRLRHWDLIRRLKDECLPLVSEEMEENRGTPGYRERLTRQIGDEYDLMLAMFIPSAERGKTEGYAGIKIDERYLRSQVLPGIIQAKYHPERYELSVHTLNGDLILGDLTPNQNPAEISTLFSQSFPPWRIDGTLHESGPGLFRWLFKSYYFWTLTVMLAILVSGLVILSRIIAHEKEVLKLKEAFVSSVSHEFKTPISSIMALTESLLQGNVRDKDRLKEYYSVIANDASNLEHLVENFLDFSRMEEEKKTYHFDETHLDVWLQELIDDFSQRAPDWTFHFRKKSGETSFIQKIDRNSMKLTIYNLLDNAVKFSEPGTEINLQLEKTNDHVLISCVDQGIGIPGEEHTRIFEKFYRGQEATRKQITGTGLGLAIVKQVTDAHGGELRVTSEAGEGATISIVLPLKKQKNVPTHE
jgi:signal transduction histidine kinase/tetratricopeptide (TPR) repeat protein